MFETNVFLARDAAFGKTLGMIHQHSDSFYTMVHGGGCAGKCGDKEGNETWTSPSRSRNLSNLIGNRSQSEGAKERSKMLRKAISARTLLTLQARPGALFLFKNYNKNVSKRKVQGIPGNAAIPSSGSSWSLLTPWCLGSNALWLLLNP